MLILVRAKPELTTSLTKLYRADLYQVSAKDRDLQWSVMYSGVQHLKEKQSTSIVDLPCTQDFTMGTSIQVHSSEFARALDTFLHHLKNISNHLCFVVMHNLLHSS